LYLVCKNVSFRFHAIRSHGKSVGKRSVTFYRMFRAQADWTSTLPSELPTKRAAPLAEKNAVAGLSDFSVRGAGVAVFFSASGAALSQ
jgi:hypothetical protein